jgi:glycine zipper 2TM protein
MTRWLLVAIATAAPVSGCSNGRTHSTSATEDQANTAHTLRVAAPDTAESRDTIQLSSRDSQPVSPMEQAQVPRNTASASKKPVRHHSTARATPKPADTATVQGYAPNQPADTSAPSASPVDTNTGSSVRDTSALRDTVGAASAPDTTPAAPEPPPVDTIGASDPSRVTARSATLDTVRNDTSAADTALTPNVPNPVPAANESAADASRRTLPIGTEIHAALDDSISSRHDSAGRSITAQVSENVTGAGGRILIPSGSTVHLTVTRLGSSKSKNSPGRLGLRVDSVQLGNEVQKVEATVQPVSRELRGRGVTGGDAAKVGVGAAGGAVLGRVIGGNTKGAVIGGVVGAAGGAVVASQTATRDVVVKAKTPVVFVLTAPLVTP